MSKIDNIWYTRCPVPTTSGIAQHYRWLHDEFAKAGISIESIRASDDKNVRRSHFDHNQPNSFREGGNIPPLWAKGNGQDTVVVGITWVDEEQHILVREDSSIQSLEDLRGVRLGLPKRTGDIVDVGRGQDLRGLLSALKIGGIGRGEVTFVDIPTREADLREENNSVTIHPGAAALIDDVVDAIYAKGAVSATLIAQHGFRSILDINAQKDPLDRVNAGTPRPITVNADLVRDHPEIVARYLAILQATAQWAKSNRDAVIAAIAAETRSTTAAVEQAFGPYLQDHFEVSLSPLYQQGLRQQKDFLVEEGFIKDFDFDAWIAPEPLELARHITLATELKLPVREDIAA